MAAGADSGRRAATRWDPDQYHRFTDHRLRPALDLLDHIPLAAPPVVYDLGCGTGAITRLLAERWPDATVIGVDSSPEMLATASAEAGPVRWVEGDIRDWQPDERPNLIYSNATLQWIDGHRELFTRLVGMLAPGGCLAVQVPLSWGMRSHVLMRETLANGGPGGAPLGTPELARGVGRKWVDEPEEYYDLLVGRTRTLDIWSTEYLHVLSGDDAVLEWVKGTGLRPLLDGLAPDEREVYLAEYRHRLRAEYPMRSDGHTLYPFRRLFLVATV